MRRICLFSFYDEHGIIDDYVIYFLREIGRFAEKIIFFSNGPLAHDSETALDGVVAEVIVRPNEGFDVMAYKEGLERIGFDAEGLYDEVLMVNHTCYGPIFPFAELFGEMEKRECDFWGVTAHLEMTPNPLTGTGTLPYHLNANFIVVRSRMLRSEEFQQYWKDLAPTNEYIEAVLSHEAYFTKKFIDLEFIAECYINSRKYGTPYPLVLDIDETIADRNPLLKRRSFFHDPRYLESNGADLPRALRIIKEKSDYNQELIWRNIVRSSELRILNTNSALTSIIPDVRIKTDNYDYRSIAVCAHVYYTEMLEELLLRADTIPVPYDFIATTETEEKKEIIEKKVAGRKNIKNVIVRVVEQNRGRDMSSLFITCRDLFLDDRYDLVCRLHTKKSPQVPAGRGNLFKRHMLENLLNSPGFTTNILDMFEEKPWIGVAIPPVVQISYGTMGHAWYANREKAAWVRQLLDINVQPDPYTPIAAYGTMFWFRPKAIRKLFAYEWKWEDFNAEPHHVDGGLAHALERTICYAAQDAGYTTEQVLSCHLAGWNYAVLEYKLQHLSASFITSDFNYQCSILEQRAAAGYPIIDMIHPSLAQVAQVSIEPPIPVEASNDMAPYSVGTHALEHLPTLRVVGANFLVAAKRSLAYRHPKLFQALRPVYRMVTGRSGRPS